MIRVKLFRLQTSGWACDHEKCAHSLKYHDNIIGDVFYLKQNEICLAITSDHSRELYCRDCVDLLYKELKPVLNSKLWPFE